MRWCHTLTQPKGLCREPSARPLGALDPASITELDWKEPDRFVTCRVIQTSRMASRRWCSSLRHSPCVLLIRPGRRPAHEADRLLLSSLPLPDAVGSHPAKKSNRKKGRPSVWSTLRKQRNILGQQDKFLSTLSHHRAAATPHSKRIFCQCRTWKTFWPTLKTISLA